MTCETPVKSVMKCGISNVFDRITEVYYLKTGKVQTITTVMIYVIIVSVEGCYDQLKHHNALPCC
jgi:hypothetical protein